MNDLIQLRKKKILVQFSDGSIASLSCLTVKKDLLVEVDVKSSLFWKAKTNTSKGLIEKDKMLKDFKKLFSKVK